MNIGLDVGRGYVKATDLNKYIIFPSFICKARERNLENDNDKYIIEINGEKYFVGELAKNEGGTREFVKNKAEQNIIPFVLTVLALFEEKYFNIVVGLPISDYKAQRKLIAEKIKGEYKVKLNGNERNIVIENVIAFPEGAGALWGLILDNKGNVANPILAEKRIGIIDIGFKTVDFCILNKLKYEDVNSSSIPIGIHQAYTRIYQRIIKEKDILPEDVEELENQPEYEELANKIINYINQFWKNNIDEVYICGGGAKYLKNYMAGYAKVVIDPVFANSIGFAKIANWRFLKCESYQLESQKKFTKESIIWKIPQNS